MKEKLANIKARIDSALDSKLGYLIGIISIILALYLIGNSVEQGDDWRGAGPAVTGTLRRIFSGIIHAIFL